MKLHHSRGSSAVNRHLTRRHSPLPSLAQTGSIRPLALLAGLTLGLVIGLLPAQAQEASPTAPAVSPTSGSSDIRPTLKLGSQGAAVSELQSLLKLLGYYTGAVDGSYQDSTAKAVSAFQQAVQLQPDGIAGAETWSRLLPKPPVQATASPATASPATASPATASPAPVSANVIPSGATLSPAMTQPTAPPAAPTSPAPGYSPAAPAVAAPTTSSAVSSAEPVLRRGMEGESVTQLQTRLQTIGVFSGAVDGVFGTETELAVQEAQRNFNLEPDGIVGPATWEALRR